MRYGDQGDSFRLGGYASADAAINYLWSQSFMAVKNAKLGVTLQNLADRHSIYFYYGTSNIGLPLYFPLPGRSFQVNLSASF